MPARYRLTKVSISDILSDIRRDSLAIPDMQRPFVWDSARVRDLIDSLYRGYPIGYIILWNNPDAMVREGGTASGRSSLIDGQQRIMAIATAIAGKELIGKDEECRRIRIAFNPYQEKFMVADAITEKDGRYIEDIAPVFEPGFDMVNAASVCYESVYGVPATLESINPVLDSLNRLHSILSFEIGMISLDCKMDIDEVNSVFTRINSKGVNLSKYDFVMSRLASDTANGGYMIKKTVDYFGRLLRNHGFWKMLEERDPIFISSQNAGKIAWVPKFDKKVYLPKYRDILQTAYIYKFHGGWISDLIKQLNGWDTETKAYNQSIAENSFRSLNEAVMEVANHSNFSAYVSLLENMGIVNDSIVHSDYVLNFGYALFLLLKDRKYKGVDHIVKRWIALSVLTGRYVSAPGNNIEKDINDFWTQDPEEVLKRAESTDLPDSFWEAKLIDSLETSSAVSPFLGIFQAAMAKTKTKAFLRNGTDANNLLTGSHHFHHVFPKKYLIRHGLNSKMQYNQIANLICMDPRDNMAIHDMPPCEYMAKVIGQCSSGEIVIGDISDRHVLEDNLKQNCIPDGFENMDFSLYNDFLERRRILMAQAIRKYYFSL